MRGGSSVMVPCTKMVVTVHAFPRFLHVCLLIPLGRFARPGSWYLVFTDSLYYCSLIQSFEHPAGTGDGICLTTHRRLLCKVPESSHPEQGAERDKLHPKTTPFSAPNRERLQGANWTVVISNHPSSFLPHHAFSSFSRYLFDFSFLSPFPPPSFIFCMSFSHLGTVKRAAGVAGEALNAYVKQPVQWGAAGLCFGAGLVGLGSAGLALGWLQMNRKSTALG